MESYSKEITINASAQEVYQAITTQEGLSRWWAPCEVGSKVGEEATFHFDKDFATFRIEKLDPNKEVVWKCTNHHFTITGSDKTDEWIGTTVRFNLSRNPDGATALSFIHEGLTPNLDCCEACFDGWNYFLESLKQYLETGKGTPYGRSEE